MPSDAAATTSTQVGTFDDEMAAEIPASHRM